MPNLNVSSLFKEAQSAQAADFSHLIGKAMDLLRHENGQIGNFTVNNRLIELEPKGEALVVGDLHGDLESLNAILQRSAFLEKIKKNKEASLIFLGDYGDRGEKSEEIYHVVLNLKLAFPEQVTLLRGNHEAPGKLLGSPHDLPSQFQSKFKDDWKTPYQKIRSLFSFFYNAVYVENRYLMVHGGVSQKISSLHDIAQADEGQDGAVLEELLWSDPDEELQGVSASPRGAGVLFGKNVTDEVLSRLNVKVLIRGHEPSNVGYKINHNGKVLTLFSRKGAPYFNRSAAYMQMPISAKIEDATQLIPWLHKF
jgi:diadenosine tetraphosphatase ApaH/serine/threonine PP2A family protein phosphatase